MNLVKPNVELVVSEAQEHDMKKSYKEHTWIEMNCTNCGAPAGVKVDSDVKSVVCWRCCASYGPLIVERHEHESTGFPKGWKFFKQFVHTDGRVFEKGVENESLKGTLAPTQIKDKPKLSKFQKEQKKLAKEKKLAEKYKRKQEKLEKLEKKKLREQKKREQETHQEQFFE